MSRFGWMLLCVLCIAASTSIADSELAAVGDDQHLWILLPEQGDASGWNLVHTGHRSGDQDYRVVRRFDVQPVAMSSLGRTLWLVFNGSPNTTKPRLELYRLQADFQPSVELYVMMPREGLDTLPPITGIERLLCFAGTSDGPVLVGRPSDAHEDSGEVVGLQLRQGRWDSFELPDGMLATSAVFGTQTDRGLLLAQSSGSSLSTWLRDQGGRWTHHVVAGVDDPVDVLDVDGQPLLVQTERTSMVALAYLQDELLWPLASLPLPTDPWAVVGQRGEAQLVSVLDRTISLDVVDAMTGDITRTESLEPVSVLTTGLWSIAIAVGLASTVILVIVLARGGDLSSMVVPRGWAVLPPLTRLGALCIDLLPGLCVFFLIAAGDWRHLVRAPLMSLNSLDFGPYLMFVGTTVLWCGAFEFLLGTSPGKMLVGASVRSTEGARPRCAAVCIRNVMKGLVLLVPPLAVLTLLHPNQQGVGDLLARTIVVRKQSPIEVDQQ